MPATTLTLNNILNYNFGVRAYPYSLPDTIMYFGLSTTLVGATGLATVTEPATAAGYARYDYNGTNAPETWTTSTEGTLSNVNSFSFSESSSAWGTILSIFIADAYSRNTGHVLWYQTLYPSLYVPTNFVVTFPAHSIVASMT